MATTVNLNKRKKGHYYHQNKSSRASNALAAGSKGKVVSEAWPLASDELCDKHVRYGWLLSVQECGFLLCITEVNQLNPICARLCNTLGFPLIAAGFLLTCNNREKECVRESYNLLNEYIDKLYPDQPPAVDDDAGDVDVEDEIAKEVAAIKSDNKRLRQCDTRCKNIIFVTAPTHVDPTRVVRQIFEDIESSQKQKTRFALRLLPVTGTCKASEEAVEKCVEQLIQNGHLPNEETTFVIQCKIRNNSDLSRMAFIECAASVIKKHLTKWRVNFDNPTVTLNIDVIVKIACVTFLTDFSRFKKYNLVEMVTKSKGEAGVGKTAENEPLDNAVTDANKAAIEGGDAAEANDGERSANERGVYLNNSNVDSEHHNSDDCTGAGDEV